MGTRESVTPYFHTNPTSRSIRLYLIPYFVVSLKDLIWIDTGIYGDALSPSAWGRDGGKEERVEIRKKEGST